MPVNSSATFNPVTSWPLYSRGRKFRIGGSLGLFTPKSQFRGYINAPTNWSTAKRVVEEFLSPYGKTSARGNSGSGWYLDVRITQDFMGVQGKPQAAPRSFDMQALKVESGVSSAGVREVCDNPLCDASFEQSGTVMQPRKFCCNDCRMNAWIIRRAAKLFESIPRLRVLEILRGG
jgi:hypothetical protein